LSIVLARRRSGFTVLEVLIVIAIASLMMTAAIPFVGRFQQSETVQSLAEDIVHTLVRAQNRAMTGDGRMRWGVRFLSGSYVMYAGNSYTTRLTARDETHALSIDPSVSGRREYTFETVFGRPVQSGSLIISHAQGGTITIDINGHGGIFIRP
jgi:prepilin-type N-terminal cleavage/methylation domain-containing protein